MLPNTFDRSFAQSTSEVFIPESEPIINPEIPESSVLLTQPSAGLGTQTIGNLPRICFNRLGQGCYRITFAPIASLYVYRGTLRVDYSQGTIISGDLYKFREIVPQEATSAALANFDNSNVIPNNGSTFQWPNFAPFEIPVYPRRNYYSYLKVTGIQYDIWQCTVTLTIEEFLFIQPPAGSFGGSFPTTSSREVTVVLSKRGRPGTANPYWEGSLYAANGAERGSFTMTWVSPYFRKASLGISTLEGTVPPYPVNSEWFPTVFADAGWELNAGYGLLYVPAPEGVDPYDEWTKADLHNLMTTVRSQLPSIDLDNVWHLNLLVVPAKLGSGRGWMFDTIDPPREGVGTYCDDGYNTPDQYGRTHGYGTAANKKQRDVPRAYLRSACHEVGHGFNQVHQDLTAQGEPGEDNSIMTPTPLVADHLEAHPPNVFPDDISLKFNAHVKRHLVHFPDSVVRPGGMTFTIGHEPTLDPVPQADVGRYFFAPNQLELNIQTSKNRLQIGEPYEIDLELSNKSNVDIPLPTDISTSAQHTSITVVNPHGVSRRVKSFVIQTDSVSIRPLISGAKIKTHVTLFWSSNGFAFETPGKHTIEAKTIWNYQGYQYGVRTRADVWLDFPTSDSDNEIASLLLHDDVGKFVALGGALHLKEAVTRINKAASIGPDHAASRSMTKLLDQEHARKQNRKNKQQRSVHM
jgi:hypothetical protein